MKSARELRKLSGILSNKPKRNVISFYGSDEFSRMCPGKKNMFLLKSMVEGKHLLLVNFKELHVEFLKRYNKKIGLKWCILVGGASSVHTVCICEYHQNFKLLASTITELSDYKDLLKKLSVVPTTGTVCLEVVTNVLQGIVLELFTRVSDMHETENLSYCQWQKDNKICTIIQLNSTIEEFMDQLCKQVNFLCEHHYIKNSQATYLEHCKSTLPEDNVLVLLDFPENYSFIIQDAIEGYH